MRFITSIREYREVYSNNNKIYGILFIYLKKKIPEDLFAVGIVVSKKVGNAVIRNRVKRRVRAFLRENAHQHPANLKLVIIAKPDAGEASWQEITSDLNLIWCNK